MENSKRRFLKTAGATVLGFSVAGPAIKVIGATEEHGHAGAPVREPQTLKNKTALKAKQWALVIDTRKLKSASDLEPMIEACHKIHNVPVMEDNDDEIKWIWEEEYEHAFPMKENKFLNHEVRHRPFLVLCNHCENPPCVRACPTQATFKRNSDGVVLMDFHRCIGCRFCMAACPFGARSFNFRDPRGNIDEINTKFPTRTKGVVEKCNFCAERLAVGRMPACVEASDGALVFGDLYDPQSPVRELLSENYTIRRKQSLGTEPCVYYIV